MNAPSLGVIALFLPNEHYASIDDYLGAISTAKRTEYEPIVAAGFTLQIDAPDLAMGRHIMYRGQPDEVFVARIATHIDVLQDALRDIPAEQDRLHVCWGNYEGPHHFDIGAEKIIGEVLRAKPGTILFEYAFTPADRGFLIDESEDKLATGIMIPPPFAHLADEMLAYLEPIEDHS
jgi:5-methyltetrahydropteroyltriglutamate--homocysteine methyltransferase